MSPDDPRLSVLRDLRAHAGAATSMIVLEGELVLRRALDAGHRVVLVVATEPCALRLGEVASDLSAVLDAGELSRLVGHEFHRGCLGVVPRPAIAAHGWRDAIATVMVRPAARILALDRVADAENVGAVLRTASALGVDLVLLGRGCADPWSRRAIRTSMGHALVQPLATDVDLVAAIDASPHEFEALSWWTTGSHGATTPLRPWARPPSLPTHLALVVGNEGQGVAAPIVARCARSVAIATRPGAESLNVAAATAILSWCLAAEPEISG